MTTQARHQFILCTFIGLVFIGWLAGATAAQQEPKNARSLLATGEKLYAQEEYEEALSVFIKAQLAAQQPVDLKSILTATRYISNCLYGLGRYEQALESYRETLQLQQQANDNEGIADTWLRLGNCQYALGDINEAIDHYRRSLELAKDVKSSIVTAESLSSIGFAYFIQGENKLALDHYYQSLNHFAAAGNKNGITQALQNIGNANFRLENHRLAFEAFQNARFLFTESGKPDEAHEVLLAIGLVHFAQKSYPFALEAYQKALLYFEELNNKSLIALALYRIGLVKYGEGNYLEALSNAERAAALAMQSESYETLWRAQLEIGRALLRLNQNDKAKQAWLQSINTIERMRANLRGNDTDSAVERTAPYVGMIELLVEENNPVEGFNYAERARAQILWGILQGGRNRITKTLTAAEAGQEQQLRRDAMTLALRLERARRKGADEAIVKRLRDQSQTARTALLAFTSKLYLRHPQLRIYRGEAPPLKAGEAFALLSEQHRALLQFVVTEQQVLLFVLTKTPRQTKIDLNTYKLDVNPATLQERVLLLRTQITSKSDDYAILARELFDSLIRPALPQLAGKTTLTIVPDGILWALPFAVLQAADNRFWVEGCSITYAGSISALHETNKLLRLRQTLAPPSLLAILPSGLDSAVLDKYKVDPVIDAEQSSLRLQKIYGEQRSTVQTGFGMTEERLRQSSNANNLVQFFAPALVNNYRPLYSFVLLSPADETHSSFGVLPMWKLANWNLRTELVSFPNTVVSPLERRSGHGFTGIGWITFVAGSAGALMSHWPAKSDEWLTAFHEQTKARRTNAAQLAAIKLIQNPEFRHPAHWAGFAFFGAGR